MKTQFDVIFTLNKNGDFLFVSPAWERHFGFPVSDVLGRSFAPFVHPDDVASLIDYLTRVLSTGRSGDESSLPSQARRMASGAGLLPMATPYVDTKGEVQLIGVSRDITEQRETQQARQESENRYRQLVDKTDTGFVVVDEEGIVVEANEPYMRLIRAKTMDEIVGHSVIEWTASEERDNNAAAVPDVPG